MTSNRSVSEMVLRPCPFCGCAALAMHDWQGFWVVRCNNDGTLGKELVQCNAAGPERPAEAEAITAWNTRASSQAQSDDVVERVVNAVITAFEQWFSDPSREPGDVLDLAGPVRAALEGVATPPAGGVEERLREALEFIAGHDAAANGLSGFAFELVETLTSHARATLNESSAIGGGDGR